MRVNYALMDIYASNADTDPRRELRINGHLCVIRAGAFLKWEVKMKS